MEINPVHMDYLIMTDAVGNQSARRIVNELELID